MTICFAAQGGGGIEEVGWVCKGKCARVATLRGFTVDMADEADHSGTMPMRIS